jgi:lambda repressor-like predicted transcriptional regulator
MKTDLTQYVEAVLRGASMRSQADLAGVNVNTLRREVLKHPNYESAKAQGLLHAWSKPASLAAAAPDHPAVADVIAGSTLQAAAQRHNVPLASLQTMLKIAHPNFSARYRDKTPEEISAIRAQKAKEAMEKAQRAAAKIQELGAVAEPTYAVPTEDVELVRSSLRKPEIASKIVEYVKFLRSST